MNGSTRQTSSLAHNLLDFYLFGNVHIALCAVALTYCTTLLLNFPMRGEWVYVVFGGTLALYSYQRWIGVKQKENVKFQGIHHQWNIRNEKTLLALTIGGLILAGIAIVDLSKQAWFVVLLTAFLSLLYSAPIFSVGGRKKRLRDITGTKLFLIAITWSLVCVWIPLADVYKPSLVDVFSMEFSYVWKWTFACFLMTFALTIPFDIRDMEFDKGVLRSLPMIFGETKIKRLAIILVFLSGFLLWNYEANISHSTFPEGRWRGYLVWSFIAAVTLSFCNSKRHEYYFSFWVDGLILILPVSLVVLG